MDKLNKPETITLVIANLYGSGRHFVKKEVVEFDKDWTAITEPVEVRFVPRDEIDIIHDELERLDRKEAEKRAELSKALDAIQEERSKLLAITYQPDDELPDGAVEIKVTGYNDDGEDRHETE